ncbi:MAG: GlsB/YeaQ/YmgE family stress response membrane protein [Candidatus Omnitrophica bacterium]|nr:GlsB/YeaQ/YmgE family stress response membrane protein [Candidatus Omnitrophota bacterium]
MEHNTIGQWVWFLVIGGAIGWLAGLIVSGRGFGIIGDIVIGIFGAMLGGWIAREIGLSTGSSSIGAFLVALGGAVILVGLTRLVVRHA